MVERRLPALPGSLAGCPGRPWSWRGFEPPGVTPPRPSGSSRRRPPRPPTTRVIHGFFAQYWLSRRQPARADYEASLALSLDPDCAEALVVVGQILDLKGQAPAAFQAFEKAARLGKGDAEAHYQLGVVLFRRKLHAGAVRRVREGGRAAPDPTPAASTIWRSASKRWAKPSGRRGLPERAAGERRRSLLRFVPGLQLRALPPQAEAPRGKPVTPRPRGGPASRGAGVSTTSGAS